MAISQATGTGSNLIEVKLFTTGDNGTSWDIDFRSVEYVYVIEDLFSFCLSGKICFRDTIGISEFGPLNGSEKIVLRFGNTEGDGKYKTLVMDILKIEKLERFKGFRPASGDTVELILADQSYHRFHSHFWNKSWTDTKISDIVKDIAKNHLQIETFVDFEPTQEKIEYFDTHSRTPSECISWLMNRASGSKTKVPGYVFYHGNNPESEDFGWNFVTLEKLMQEKKWMLPFDTTAGEPVYVFENENPYYINKIKDHKIFNVDLNALKSLSGGTLLGWDIRRKKLIKQMYTYQDAVKKFTILGKKTLFPTELNIDHPSIRVDGDSDEIILDNLWYGNWAREYAHQQLVHINVDGHPQRKCGGMIRIIWPTHAEHGDKGPSYNAEVFNKQMDGRYLIKSITNYFNPNISHGWQQKLVCIKNGYKDSPNPNLVPAVKTNL